MLFEYKKRMKKMPQIIETNKTLTVWTKKEVKRSTLWQDA
jgi:hypothetical protein